MKQQTAERARFLKGILEEIRKDEEGINEHWIKMTELSRLLEEDVEVGHQTTGVFSDLGQLGEKAIKAKTNTERAAFARAHSSDLDEAYQHLQKALQEVNKV